MLGIKEKLVKDEEADKQLQISTSKTLAKFIVWEEYLKAIPPIVPSEERKIKDYKTAFDTLIISAKHDPDQFREVVYRFQKLAESGKLPDYDGLEDEAKALHVALDVITSSGSTRADAGKWIASRMIGRATKHSAKSLNVDMSQYYGNDKKSKKSGLFSGLFSPKSAGVFDANTKDTTEGNRAERTIDRDKFKEDRFYRKVLEDDMKRIKKRGGLSDEENALVNEHNRLIRAQNGKVKKETSEADKIIASMTAGEKAMYDMTALVGKGLFNVGKGLFKFATKSRKTSPLDEDASLEAERATKRAEIYEPEDKSLEIERATKRAEIYEPEDKSLEIERATKRAEIYGEDDAKKEASFEKASEFEEKQLDATARQIEVANKQIEILGKIDEDIKNIKIENGVNGGIIDTAMDVLDDMPSRKTPNKAGSKMGKLAKFAKRAGVIGAVADVGFGVNDLLEGKAQEEMPSGIEMISPMKWGMYGGDKINKGVEAITGGESIGSMAYDLINPEDKDKAAKDTAANFAIGKAKREARLKAEELQVEGVKKDIAPKLEEKQEKAETAKEEKSNANMAGAVSNVVNNSPNNSVVAPSAPQQSRGRDTPRNPDNSLSDYLKSRVLKFT